MSDEKNDVIVEARRRFQEAQDYWSETRSNMLEDLRFSNPADPEQWDDRTKNERERSGGGARPCLVFDQTNQYIAQVVNDARENKPAIKVRPKDGDADVKVAEVLQGLIRHTEDISRAGMAYDTAIEYSARCGMGYIRVLTKVIDNKMNMQELIIDRIHDPLSVYTDPYWTDPDGADMTYAFVETKMPKDMFQKKYPDKSLTSWFDGDGWLEDKAVRICEYFEIVEEEVQMVLVQDQSTGDMMEFSAEQFNELNKNLETPLQSQGEYKAVDKTCIWRKITGNDILEETTFPSVFIPIVPVIGNETWVDGKRYLSGMVRRMRDPQRAYNYERSAYIEMVSLQPKAPYISSVEAIEGYEEQWMAANSSNQAILPYNHIGVDGQPLPPPSRQAPIQASQAFVQGAQMAIADLQASIGMYRANLGAPSNETSGRAINARQREGDQANFHYIDNLARSMTQVGKICIGAYPYILDTKQQRRILGEDGQTSQIQIDPNQAQPKQKTPDGSLIINPNIGLYDVTVTVGPAYATKRQEVIEMVAQLTQGNPQLGAALAPIMIRMADMPDGDKISQIAISLLPPQVQAAYKDEDTDESPETKAAMAAKDKQIKDAESVMQQLKQELQQCQAQLEDKSHDFQLKQQELSIKMQEVMLKAKDLEHYAAKDVAATEINRYNAETARFAAEQKFIQQNQTASLTNQTIAEMMDSPTAASTTIAAGNDLSSSFSPVPDNSVPLEQSVTS